MSRILISSINKAIKNKQSVITFSLTQNINKEIIKLLQNSGFIQSSVFRGNYIIITLKQTYWKSWGVSSPSIINMHCPKFTRQAQAISSKQWSSFCSIKGSAFFSIMDTDRGYVTSKTNGKIGGFPLLTLL